MANASIKALVIVALAGTSLSGCSIVGSAANGAWSGTKAVAGVATYPVRRVLRGAPDTDTQFASVETEEVVEVKTASIEGGTTTTTSTQKTVEIVETVNLSATESYDVVTVDSTSFIQLNGEGSLKDWRACEVQSKGYWVYNDINMTGSLNPKFESCMRAMDYTLETQLSDAMLAMLKYDVKETSDTVLLAETVTETKTVKTDMKMAAAELESDVTIVETAPITLMAETIVEVENPTVMGTSMVTKTTTTAKQSGDILDTVKISANKSYDIVTVDDVLFIRLNGEASMTEWRACETRTNGYWVFDETNVIGSLNPDFENCMQGLDYTLETELGDDLPAVFLDDSDDVLEITETAELAMDVQPTP